MASHFLIVLALTEYLIRMLLLRLICSSSIDCFSPASFSTKPSSTPNIHPPSLHGDVWFRPHERSRYCSFWQNNQGKKWRAAVFYWDWRYSSVPQRASAPEKISEFVLDSECCTGGDLVLFSEAQCETNHDGFTSEKRACFDEYLPRGQPACVFDQMHASRNQRNNNRWFCSINKTLIIATNQNEGSNRDLLHENMPSSRRGRFARRVIKPFYVVKKLRHPQCHQSEFALPFVPDRNPPHKLQRPNEDWARERDFNDLRMSSHEFRMRTKRDIAQ